MEAKEEQLPVDVKEQATTKTSIYQQGELIYDGATGKAVGGDGAAGAASTAPGGSLNEFLKWGIENSNPEELARQAASGESARAPSQMDREIMDMLLGQPTVAKMRACLGFVEADKLKAAGGLEAALAQLEELEYYVEDVDNAIDLAKIGGLSALMRCAEAGPADVEPGAEPEELDELREAACGVIAAAVQNNPELQKGAAYLEVHTMLLRLLGEAGADGAACGLPVRRKALLALSAMLRGAEAADGDGALLRTLLPPCVPTLCRLGGDPDPKLAKRALFSLGNLAANSVAARDAVGSYLKGEGEGGEGGAEGVAGLRIDEGAGLGGLGGLLGTLARAVRSDDEDVRGACLQLLGSLSGSAANAAPLAARLKAAGAADAWRAAAEKIEAAGEEENASHAALIRRLVAWLAGGA